MATYRDIDYNTRINGSLLVSLPSTFSSDLAINGKLNLGAITDAESVINLKVDKDALGNVTVNGNLTVTGDIVGIDLSQYYTKVDLQTAGSASVHWNNITNKATASTTAYGIVQLTDSSISTSLVLAPTANALKQTHDLAAGKWTYSAATIQGVKVDNAFEADNAATVNNLTVLTAVPSGALFTDTVYTHPLDHPISFITGLQDTLDTKADKSQVLTNVPAGAKFTETTINNKTGVISKADIVALGIPAQDTVYVHATTDPTHPLSMITETETLKVLTAAERTDIASLTTDYYTKANLQTSGLASVHWGNITAVPTYDNYSKWILKVNSEAVGHDVISSGILDFKGSGSTSVSRLNGVITISSVGTVYTAGNGLGITGSEFYVNTADGIGIVSDNVVNTDKGSSQNIWKTISDGVLSIAADANSDTLTIAGSGAIATSVSGKTVTIAHTDSDHTSFSKLAGDNVFTGRLILQTDSQPAAVTTRVAQTFASDTIALGTSVDALTEVLYQASTGTATWAKDTDYLIDYKTGVISRVLTGSIPNNATVYVTYVPTRFVLKIKGGTADTTDYLQIDNKGNLYGKSMTVNLTSSQSSTSNDVQGDFTIQGNLIVNGQTTLGDDNMDTTTINGSLTLYNQGIKKFELDNNGTILLGAVPWARLTSVPDAAIGTQGIVALSDSISTTSSILAATPTAVKAAYDLAVTKWVYNAATIQAVKVNSALNADTVNNLTVLSNVPLGAVFTDTVTTVNGNTGVITKEDIVALGIPGEAYVHPATHSADMIIDGTTNKAFTAGEKTKLMNIADYANNYTLENHDRTKHTDINQSLLTTDTVQFGNIGIGTATPNFEVDVAGDIRIREQGAMKFGGVGSTDAKCEIKFNPLSKTIDFNFLS